MKLMWQKIILFTIYIITMAGCSDTNIIITQPATQENYLFVDQYIIFHDRLLPSGVEYDCRLYNGCDVCLIISPFYILDSRTKALKIYDYYEKFTFKSHDFLLSWSAGDFTCPGGDISLFDTIPVSLDPGIVLKDVDINGTITIQANDNLISLPDGGTYKQFYRQEVYEDELLIPPATEDSIYTVERTYYQIIQNHGWCPKSLLTFINPDEPDNRKR
ncbi:MAG: hypothetical protein C0417_13500 [Chlorobiaceae bacterium]|nr:hypothetical protein [Chlorobiaceae bacterium]